MARNKKANPEVEEIKEADGILYLRATRGLTVEEHTALSEKLRYEEQESGLKTVLIPFLLEPVEGEA